MGGKLTLMASILLLLSGCQSTPPSTFACSEDTGQVRAMISSSFAIQYPDVKSLGQHADLVVTGTISDKNKWCIASRDNPETIMTISELAVDNVVVVKGDQVRAGDRLHIKQKGGFTADLAVISPDTTLLQAGDEVLLFLKKNDDGTYILINDDDSLFRRNEQGYTNVKTKQVTDIYELDQWQK